MEARTLQLLAPHNWVFLRHAPVEHGRPAPNYIWASTCPFHERQRPFFFLQRRNELPNSSLSVPAVEHGHRWRSAPSRVSNALAGFACEAR